MMSTRAQDIETTANVELTAYAKMPHPPALRVALISDYLEENWPSMDLVAQMLFEHLGHGHAQTVCPTLIRPAMKRRFGRIPLLGDSAVAQNADKLCNRFGDYRRVLRQQRNDFDLFHIIDHSYSHLIEELPAERTIITCHDLDTFECLLTPTRQRRSYLFRLMTAATLAGFRHAAHVLCVSRATYENILKHNLLPAERLSIVRNGVHPSCTVTPDSVADKEIERLLGAAKDGTITLLHVGSTIPRKRIDVLLAVVAAVRARFPTTRLVRVGAPLTASQQQLLNKLRLTDATVSFSFLERRLLAALYRYATLVLQPSEREGFGLPVAESLACGTPVVASDLAVLREVGGEAAIFCSVANITEWTEKICELLTEKESQPQDWASRRAKAVAHAQQFSWTVNAAQTLDVYKRVMESSETRPAYMRGQVAFDQPHAAKQNTKSSRS
jgi:glycosyltransferase involved in cell wall biosynthesis